jgi:uncharacterized membrane protein
MTGMIAITILAAAAAPATAPAAILSPPPPPLTIVMESPAPPRIIERTSDQPLALFDVAIMAGRDPLWSDSVRVGQAGVNYTQSLRQADEICPGRPRSSDEAYRYVESSRQLNFSLSRRGSREVDSFSVNVRWQRPVSACEGGGNRGVTVEQQMEIAPGQTVRLNGDAGLIVSLTRRPR